MKTRAACNFQKISIMAHIDFMLMIVALCSQADAYRRDNRVQVRLNNNRIDIARGTVEILINGVWGTICDDRWDINDATVICRMLGFPSAIEAHSWAAYGSGSGPIHLDEVMCGGTERNIIECRHNGFGNHDCGHMEDAGVTCAQNSSERGNILTSKSTATGSPTSPQITNHEKGNILTSDSTATEAPTSPQITNNKKGNISAFDSTAMEALISPQITNNEKGNISTYDTTTTEAPISAQITNAEKGNISTYDTTTKEAPISMQLKNADKENISTFDSTSMEALVSTQTSNNVKGNISTFDLTPMEALVSTQISNNVKENDSIYDTTTMETTISTQITNPEKENSWTFDSTTRVALTSGRITTANNIQMPNYPCVLHDTVYVNANYTRADVVYISSPNYPANYSLSARCRWVITFKKGSWIKITSTFFDTEQNYDFVEIYSPSTGKQWQTISGNNFSDTIAYENAAEISFRSDDIINAPGFQLRFERIDPVEVRLKNNSSETFKGTVEILMNGTWGTICDDDWDLNDANVICRMLGFQFAFKAHSSAAHGSGTGPIYLDDVDCRGAENSIIECRHPGFGRHNCRHDEDAGVTCARNSSERGNDSTTIEDSWVTTTSSWRTTSNDHTSRNACLAEMTIQIKPTEQNATIMLAGDDKLETIYLTSGIYYLVKQDYPYQQCDLQISVVQAFAPKRVTMTAEYPIDSCSKANSLILMIAKSAAKQRFNQQIQPICGCNQVIEPQTSCSDGILSITWVTNKMVYNSDDENQVMWMLHNVINNQHWQFGSPFIDIPFMANDPPMISPKGGMYGLGLTPNFVVA